MGLVVLITSDFKCKGKLLDFFFSTSDSFCSLHRGLGACGEEKKINLKITQYIVKDGETKWVLYKELNGQNLE